MLPKLGSSLRWGISLGAKFIRVVPVATLLIVLLSLVSQISTLLASVMPLKVVIMLGSDGVPRYFPGSFSSINRDILIAALSAGTLGFFLLHLLAEHVVGWVTSASTSRLLAKSQKMVLFENQNEVAASSYQRYSRALASGVFIVLALCGVGWFYPWMSFVIVGYFFVVLFFFWGLQQQSLGFRERLESNLAQTLNLAGGVGFFVAFGFLVVDFIFWSPPGVIIAIVSLLLIRQIMQRASGMIGDLTSLYRQKTKLDALFFHGKVLLPQQVRSEKSLWPLLETERRKAWVTAVLQELIGQEKGEVDCRWLQLGTPDVAGLRAKSAGRQYLVKLFEINRSSWALHEATLMAEPASHLPAPRWVGATKVEKFHCLVYELSQGDQPQPRQVNKITQELRRELLTAQPHTGTIKRYVRSKPLLWQRLEHGMIERLRVAADTPEQQREVAMLLEYLPMLHQQLKVLPLTLHNPEIKQDAIWVLPEEGDQCPTPISLNWGRWSLEPIGSGWPENEKQLVELGDALRTAATKRPELADIRVEQAELSALAFALERECQRQRYVQALALLPALLERLVERNSSSDWKGVVND